MRKTHSVGCVIKLDNPQFGAWKIDTIDKEDTRERKQIDVMQNCHEGFSRSIRTWLGKMVCLAAADVQEDV